MEISMVKPITQEKKFYGLTEANALIPKLSNAFVRLYQMNDQLQKLLTEVREKNLLIDKNDFELDQSMDEETLDTLSSIKILLTAIQDEVDSIQVNHGVKIKSLDQGIVNIPAKNDENEMYYYWEVGHKTIDFWLDQGLEKHALTETTQDV